MARTRGASNLIHADVHGEAVDREGKPLDVSGQYVPRAPSPVHVQTAPVAPQPPQRFICNTRTVERNMEAAELVAILDIVLGGFAVELDRDEWNRLNPNVKRHFRPAA